MALTHQHILIWCQILEDRVSISIFGKHKKKFVQTFNWQNVQLKKRFCSNYYHSSFCDSIDCGRIQQRNFINKKDFQIVIFVLINPWKYQDKIILFMNFNYFHVVEGDCQSLLVLLLVYRNFHTLHNSYFAKMNPTT